MRRWLQEADGDLKTQFGRYLAAGLPRSLTFTIVLFCALIVLIVVGALTIFGLSVVERGRSDVRSMASTLEQYAIRTLEVAELVAEDARGFIVRRGLEGLEQDEAVHLHLRALLEKLPEGAGIIFVDRTGRVVASDRQFPAPPVDLSDRRWFQAHRDTGVDRVIEEALFSRVALRKMFLLTLALRDAEGTFLGAVDLGIPSDAAIGSRALPFGRADATLTILSGDGGLIARTDFPDELLGARLALPPGLVDGEVILTRSPVEGRLALLALNEIPKFGLRATASVPLVSVLQPLFLAVAGAVPLLVLTLAGAFIALRSLTRRQMELAAGKERLEAVLEASKLGSWHRNLVTGEQEMNDRWAGMLGYRLEELAPHVTSWENLLHPDEKEAVMAASQAHIDGKTDEFHCEHRMRHRQGHWIWVLDSGRVVERDAQGRGRIFTGIHMDITDRRDAEERMKVVMHEVDHRAKNLLAVVQAVVNLMRADTVAEFKAGLIGRILALARAHSLLSRHKWQGVELRRLLEEELAAYQGEVEGRLRLEGPRVALSPTASQSLAMVAHELATNAVKYGALSLPGGALLIGWRVLDGDGALELVWQEFGGPPVLPAASAGFGSTLIRQTVEAQLGGSVRMDWLPGGLRCTLQIEAEHLRPVADAAEAVAAPAPRRAQKGCGAHLLVVEDEPMVALDIVARLRAAGHEVLGPARSVAEAMALVENAALDGAILDINLRGERVFPVAERLRARGVPFLFLTGYEDAARMAPHLRPTRILHKPCAAGELEAAAAEFRTAEAMADQTGSA